MDSCYTWRGACRRLFVPTNNLDLAGLEALESALTAYRGALIGVSHDAEFMTRLGLERTLKLDRGGMPRHGYADFS